MKGNNKKKESIFAKKGFFITLVVIVAAMIITLVMNLIMPEEEKKPSFDNEAWETAVGETIKKNELYEQEAEPVTSDTAPVTNSEENTQNTEQEAVTTEDIQDAGMKMEKPVQSEITKDYSADELVYSETMQDWRVHEGIDFHADEGTEIRAAADGTVEATYQDGMMGASVVIAHDGGVKTFYGNLQEDSMPSVGTFVKTGEVIGLAGQTAALEINDGPHIHFEVIENDKRLNPHDYLKDFVTIKE
ncbi:MAG: M23 family metallopeptidase [Clostridia bacterium]|nr:M23 family metallopeptidase [Clostridia bacterium]